MPKLIITRGLPGSGKSHWARKQEGFVVVEKDQIRKELEAQGWVWSRENEKVVIQNQEAQIKVLLRDGNNVIAADTNWGKHENRLKRLADSVGADFAVRDFSDVPLKVCLERNRNREESVPESVIYSMYKQYVEPELKPVKVEFVPGLPTAIICDLDGTLAIHNGRSPYDTARCEEDLLNDPVHSILTVYEVEGLAEIIFVSGREDQFRPQTERWLKKFGYTGNKLFMRETGDYKNDTLVKNEIFDREIRGKFNVLFVLDDRDRVVKRWRELGLTCLQVAEGAF